MSEWKLVPVEPTDEMLNLLWLELGDHPSREHARDAWRSAVDAAPVQQAEPVAWADRITFLQAMKTNHGCDVWPKAGNYEQRTGRKLIALYLHPPEHPTAPQWPAPRPMSEAPKDAVVLAWWPALKAWVATWWWEGRGKWIHGLLDDYHPQPTCWLPMPAAPTEQQEVTK